MRKEDLELVHRAAAGVLEILVIPGDAAVVASARPDAAHLAAGVRRWVAWREAAAPGEGPECLTCGAPFARGEQPAVITAAVAYAAPQPAPALVGAVCGRCAEGREDLLELARQGWSCYWPTLWRVAVGSS